MILPPVLLLSLRVVLAIMHLLCFHVKCKPGVSFLKLWRKRHSILRNEVWSGSSSEISIWKRNPSFFIYFSFFLLSFFCYFMNVLPICVSVHHICAWYPQRSKEGTSSPGTGVTVGCETPWRCWGLSGFFHKSSRYYLLPRELSSPILLFLFHIFTFPFWKFLPDLSLYYKTLVSCHSRQLQCVVTSW